MTTAASAPPAPAPLRRELAGPNYAYELTLVPLGGVTLRVEEGDVHDAAVFLTPQQIVELRADLAATLLVLTPVTIPTAGIRSEQGRIAAEMIRRAFVALVELEKVSGYEVDELYRSIVAHIRSSKAHVLQVVAL